MTITVRGEPVAQLVPPTTRRRFMPRATLLAIIDTAQADAALTDELASLVDHEHTDDLVWH